EEYDGRGSYLLCQMQLTQKAGSAPAATRMVQNLLGYLAAEEAYRQPGRTALLTAADSPLRKALDDARLEYEAVTAVGDVTRERFEAAIVDATSLDTPAAGALRSFAETGGRVLVHRGTPEQQAALESLTGRRLRFFPLSGEPEDVGNRVCRRAGGGLLGGISNHELFWGSNAYLTAIRNEGVWWAYYPGGCPEPERIADFYCAPADDQRDRATELTRPGTLVQVPVGSGYVLLSQLRLDEPVADTQITVNRLTSLLLTNLGCTLRGEGGAAPARARRLQQYQYATVDLSPHANRGLRDDPAAGLTGWTNQGENDMRALPIGRQTLGDVPFLIGSPKAAVVLYSISADNKELPKEVTGIRIGQRADALFFLHSMAWGAEKPFAYRVNYDDGSSVPLEITNGREVIDWWDDPIRHAEAMSDAGAFVAWTGDNPMRQGVVLIAYEWVNPHPAKPIRDVDFLTVEANGYGTVPVLAGLTAAVMRTNEGVVTDVLGTAGVRVKVGTEEREIYYIGTVGIRPDHPYHDRAVAAHRALVVGQKVTLRDDVVTQNTAGQRLAYVYLGTDIFNVNSLVNAKIIGDGLGELGNFEGNTREQMYLENLGFIAKQRKAGMWGE
ncbi:MAG: hypothetical protein FJX74_17710, partial [Armatimonadetes bacterium]|nr:hypothetical protein [Armatimonadota bacterium]